MVCDSVQGGLGMGSLVWCLGMVLSAQAHDPDAPDLEVPEIQVEADRPVAASSQQFIPDKEYLMQPQGRPAQVLRLIPGFVAVEHSGGAGKADQYFLRGFDADHGTDVAFFTDGMPINLRSHAHGQGYTDLNFIIPETIEGVDVFKGAYLPSTETLLRRAQ
jgi:outer membrane receptor protein involved in Fe transport